MKKILTVVASITCLVVSKLSAQNTLPSSGNVGIGTIYPFAPLHVKGGTPTAIFESTNPGIEFRNSNGSGDFQMGLASGNGAYNRLAKNGDFALDKGNTLGNLFISNSYGGDVIFTTGASGWGSTARVMTIFNNGKVGIGNTTSISGDYNLVVEGAIGAKKIRVTQLGWADYVFAHTYKLLRLQDLETFINLHKHLPDVPTAEEVDKNGIDIGEMQTILLKKIEELTLYMIDLKKENELLKKRIIKLEIRK